MKKIYERITLNLIPLSEIFLLILVLLTISKLNVTSHFNPPERSASLNPMDYLLYFAWAKGNKIVAPVVTFLLLLKIRDFNKEHVFNQGCSYKDYHYFWYWICSKILGFQKCNLILVPIYMQFKLVINDTFESYECGNYSKKDNDQIIVKKINYTNVQLEEEVNLVISDTYPLFETQLPNLKKEKPIILISRDNLSDSNRYDSPELVHKVVNETRNLPQNIKKINIFATTNPKNTMNIAKDAFKLGERGNLELITVFQQKSSGNPRTFEEKGVIVYKNSLFCI
ncbi:hypothetical protein [Faecalibacillus intestinalis]|uniref:hypothetical protein n=1 Tax=Faecalibacillus intestinalis TaxID=1982626 RepID=UPI003522E1CB